MSSVQINKKFKLSSLVNSRIKVYTITNREYTGTLLSFDKHMNLVLSDVEESRITKKTWSKLKKHQNEEGSEIEKEKRSLGLIILKGDQIVCLNLVVDKLTDVSERIIKVPKSIKQKASTTTKKKVIV
ncbi:SMB1 Small nuclear ribonucleoprotein-associated protein B [Candida maltosa Xu316]|uniref:Sm protein B n=1 Tax=Candida maltosa (strain Xu316) TaxID=1245528 RepID=M3K4C2_CANMX|nr:Small nuclear ribonucleoprotein-associated protein, putative [Candida maltosa Xu316]